MTTIAKSENTDLNLYEVLDALFSKDVELFYELFESKELVFIKFFIKTLNILGKPYDLSVYRSNPEDGPVLYIANLLGANCLSEYPMEVFQEVFNDLKKCIDDGTATSAKA